MVAGFSNSKEFQEYRETAIAETYNLDETEVRIMNADGAEWVKNICDADTVFTGVKVDGNLIDKSNYTAKKGSTIITLKASYLNTLSAGTHTVEIL